MSPYHGSLCRCKALAAFPADREFWEVAIAEPNLEAWRVGNGREVSELIAQTRDRQAAVAFLQRVKSGEVAVPG